MKLQKINYVGCEVPRVIGKDVLYELFVGVAVLCEGVCCYWYIYNRNVYLSLTE
jgi:hypothetical protein